MRLGEDTLDLWVDELAGVERSQNDPSEGGERYDDIIARHLNEARAEVERLEKG